MSRKGPAGDTQRVGGAAALLEITVYRLFGPA